MHNKGIHLVSFILVIVGALNWGLVGLFQFNLVEAILGGVPGLLRIVYVLVGLGGVYLAATHTKDCRYCAPGANHSTSSSTMNQSV
ncbi:MAG TPA: DUF378 domain-containing protein [Candidatus Andersenbacteria bacterium]|nr:DUF378 domain-containing protein [Candidatus Andersenbacteria bacterium]